MRLSRSLAFISLLLISTQSSAASRDADGLTPLHRAAGRGDLASVQALLKNGEDIYALDSKMGVSILHKAVYSGSADVVAYLLDHGALVDLQSPSNGDTPLHDAIYFKGGNGLKIINVILRHHPNLSVKNRAGLTPVDSARLLKDPEVVSALTDYEKTLHTLAAQALMRGLKANNANQVKKCLANSQINLEEPDDQGFTPLIWASREGFAEIVGLLLERGASPNHEDEWMHANAAHKAAFWGRSEVMKLLVKSGMDLNARGGYNGYTPLHDAIAQGHVEVARILLEAGAKTDIPGHDGKTAEVLAKASGNPKILALFGRAHSRRELQ